MLLAIAGLIYVKWFPC